MLSLLEMLSSLAFTAGIFRFLTKDPGLLDLPGQLEPFELPQDIFALPLNPLEIFFAPLVTGFFKLLLELY